jgi:hypothetical protein
VNYDLCFICALFNFAVSSSDSVPLNYEIYLISCYVSMPKCYEPPALSINMKRGLNYTQGKFLAQQ